MSLKDEMDARVREYRLRKPDPAYLKKVDAEAKKCAERAWKKIREIFLASQEGDKPITILIGKYWPHEDPYFVYKYYGLTESYHNLFLFNGKIKHFKQTMVWLRQIAESEGILVSNPGRYDRTEHETFVYWDLRLTYNPPNAS